MISRNPKVNLQLLPITSQIVPQRKLLVLAQGLGSNFVSGEVYANIDNSYDVEGVFGAGSHAAIACNTLLEVMEWVGLLLPFDVIPIDDNGSGISATSDLVVGGTTASESKTIKLSIGTKEGINNSIIAHNTYSIAITATDAPNDVATAMKTAIDADTNALVTASISTGTLTMTAKNKGTEGNEIGVEIDGSVSGLTFTLNAFSAGANDPVLTNVLDVIDDERYDIVCIYPFILDVKSHLGTKFNTLNDILDGVSFSCKTDTYSNFTTATTGFLAPEVNNSKTTVLFANKKVSKATKKAGALNAFNISAVSSFVAERAIRFILDSVISKFMQAGNTRGGPHTTTLPYFNQRYPMLSAIPVGENFTKYEIDRIENMGGSYFIMSDDRTEINGGTVSTLAYKSDAETPEGITYRYLNNSDGFTYSRAYIFYDLKLTYAQAKLIDGPMPINTGTGVYVNKTEVEARLKKSWGELVNMGILQGGTENENDFDRNMNITINTTTNAIVGSISIKVVGQARTFTIDINTKL